MEVPAGSGAVTLLLRTSKLGDQDAAYFSGFRVEIAGGGRTWSRNGFRPLGFNSFSITLPKSDFPPGSYTIRIFASRNGDEELLAEYALQLLYS